MLRPSEALGEEYLGEEVDPVYGIRRQDVSWFMGEEKVEGDEVREAAAVEFNFRGHKGDQMRRGNRIKKAGEAMMRLIKELWGDNTPICRASRR
jgi:hypothetical protein